MSAHIRLVAQARLAYSGRMARNTLLIVPPHRLDAFAATGVLADLLRAEPHIGVEIICRESDVALFQDAPGILKFISYKDDAKPGTSQMMQTMGRTWHRIVSLTARRLPLFLWAKHRHFFRYEAGTYVLPSLFAPQQKAHPSVWIPDRLHLALPETLAPTAPLIVFATEESGRALWDWRHYAELAWCLADSVAALKQAHIVVLAPAHCPIAEGLKDNIPAGQITHFQHLAYSKQAALMRRAAVTIGTDRLAARMAPYVGCGLTLRLDIGEPKQSGRPYGLYVGHDPNEVAAYIQSNLPQTVTQSVTNPIGSDTNAHDAKADLQSLAAQLKRINRQDEP